MNSWARDIDSNTKLATSVQKGSNLYKMVISNNMKETFGRKEQEILSNLNTAAE